MRALLETRELKPKLGSDQAPTTIKTIRKEKKGGKILRGTPEENPRLPELSDAAMKVVNSNAGTDRTSADNVSGSRMVTQLGAFSAFEHKGHTSENQGQ